MRITEPQGPFRCPPCAERIRSSLRYCEADSHGLMPECPDHHRLLRWTNGGELASCNMPNGRDSQGRRTWCQAQRTIIYYDAEGHPMSAAELPVRTIGRSVRMLQRGDCQGRREGGPPPRRNRVPPARGERTKFGAGRGQVRSRGPQFWSGSGVFRLVRDLGGGALPAVAEAVAVAVHLQDMDVVGEPVQQRAGEAFRSEHLGPLIEGQVGGDQDGAPLAALAEDIEEQFRPGGGTDSAAG